MGFFQIDPNIERLLPVDTRVLNLSAIPSSDGKLLKVGLNLTPFQEKPYLGLVLTDSSGETIATTSIVEPVNWNLELNLHIRKSSSSQGRVYKLTAVLSYPDVGVVDRRDLTIEIPSTAV